MTARGILGRLAAHLAAGSGPAVEPASALWSPSSLVGADLDQTDIDREARALADEAINQVLAALPAERGRGEETPAETLIREHRGLLIQALGFTALSETLSRPRDLERVPEYANPNFRNAVVVSFLEHLHEGLAAMIAIDRAAPPATAAGAN